MDADLLSFSHRKNKLDPTRALTYYTLNTPETSLVMSAAKRFHFTQDGKTTSVTARYREMASLSSLFKKLRSYEDVWYQDQRLKDIDDINAFFLYPNGAEFQVKIQESMVRLKVLCQKSRSPPTWSGCTPKTTFTKKP